MFKYKNTGQINLFIKLPSGLKCIKPSEEFTSNKILNYSFLTEISDKNDKEVKKQIKVKEETGNKV